MKKILLLLILILPIVSLAQIDARVMRVADSIAQVKFLAANAHTDSAIKAIPPSSSTDTATILKLIRSTFSQFDSIVFRIKTSNQSSFFNLDTLKVPVNTSCYIDLVITSTVNSSWHGSFSHWEILLSNNNGVYSLERAAFPLSQNGYIMNNTTTSVGLDSKYGLVIYTTPNLATPMTWNEIYWLKNVTK